MIQINEDNGVIEFENRRQAVIVMNEISKYFRTVSLSASKVSFTFEKVDSEDANAEGGYTEKDVFKIVTMAINDVAD